jgi:hypothetical protein
LLSFPSVLRLANGPRLSCGALKKKGVIQYPTRAASFKRLLASRDPWLSDLIVRVVLPD